MDSSGEKKKRRQNERAVCSGPSSSEFSALVVLVTLWKRSISHFFPELRGRWETTFSGGKNVKRVSLDRKRIEAGHQSSHQQNSQFGQIFCHRHSAADAKEP